MTKIAKIIQDGARQFLYAEYGYMAVYIILFSIILMCFMPGQVGVATTIAFVVGAVTSIVAGWIGMSIAVFTNVRTAHECWLHLSNGYKVAIDGGCVMGLSLVSIGVIDLWLLIIVFKQYFEFEHP